MKITDKNRFIAKMVATILISAGIAGIGTGVYMCRDSIKDNGDKYFKDEQYTAGIVSLCAGAPSLSIGLATFPLDSEPSNRKKENIDTNERGI